MTDERTSGEVFKIRIPEELRKQVEEEMKIYCDCEEPDDSPFFVEQWTVPGVGLVRHHGWVCGKCRKYVQVG